MARVSPEERLSLALQHHMAHRLSKARRLYQVILEDEPENADVLHLLGSIELDAGDLHEALGHFDRCLAAGDEQAMTLTAATYNLKGETLRRLGFQEEALQCYRRSLEIRPCHAGVLSNMGAALRGLGRLDEAAVQLRAALEINPDLAEAHNNLGNVLRAVGRSVEAANAFRDAIRCQPRMLEAHNNLANCLRDNGCPRSAVVGYEQALQVRPQHGGILSNLVVAAGAAADWERLETAAQRLSAVTDRELDGNEGVSEPAFVYSVYGDDPGRLRQLAGAEVSRALAGMVAPRHSAGVRSGAIRIGYLVRGHGNQPARRQLSKLLVGHDHTRFQSFVYSYRDSARTAGPADRSEIALDDLSDSQAAQRIADDRLDVLVDLVGHLPGARPGIPASRPARLALAWPAFCTPACPSSADVIISDEVVLPRGETSSLDERVIHLRPGHQWLMHDRRTDAAPPDRHAQGLPDDALVLACFVRPMHIGFAMFDVWLELLREHPHAVLWLTRANAETVGSLAGHCARAGVSPERLIPAPRAATKAEHMARLACADICLGCRPMGAPTPVLDALWAGVPVISLHGTLPPNRSASSVMHGSGLPDLVAEDLEDYAAKLASLMCDPEARMAIRARLLAARLRSRNYHPGPIITEFETVLQRLVSQGGPSPCHAQDDTVRA